MPPALKRYSYSRRYRVLSRSRMTFYVFALLMDPGRDVLLAFDAKHDHSRFRDNESLLAMWLISGLDNTAFTLAVYASHTMLP